jgi:hypothetical protein
MDEPSDVMAWRLKTARRIIDNYYQDFNRDEATDETRCQAAIYAMGGIRSVLKISQATAETLMETQRGTTT